MKGPMGMRVEYLVTLKFIKDGQNEVYSIRWYRSFRHVLLNICLWRIAKGTRSRSFVIGVYSGVKDIV